ncbi:ATP-binding protein [Paenibacillus tritici]|uniref:HD domain-containing protein n=1 Tax=Paenibacillus tritici TaxID=1873425 RepID=UPI001BA704AE|nr:ATP-binding protein [Paenibacillus tritici]QUL54982.1 ATP-binding protein [Paenibacillus tritici]
MVLNIPDEFTAIIKKNNQLHVIVNSTVSDFTEIIYHSQFEFFPEYTEHKMDHINKVLETSLFLSKDSALNLLTPEDICSLILSILLHDIGMHLTYEGFQSIINGSYAENRIKELDSKSWPELWHSYINELKKLSGKSLINLFGQDFEIKELPNNKDYLSRLDRKVIGEFIRRHHPRLAHEIAIFGFPKTNDSVIDFAPDMESGLKDIIGIVARSHGMDIRNTFDYLQKKFDKAWRNPRNVKCIYQMVILRISDYLHITSERAPQIYLNTNNISSTISKLEWDLHKSVKEINYELPDREALFIIAEPSDSIRYLKLIKRFKDIQFEIDTSWAILGEVYNFMENFRSLGIKIRRIQSNLDSIDKFSESVSYLPREIRCQSSPELIKLLIAPLYGDNPSFGVRELLQNSIDACLERKLCDERLSSSYTPNIIIDICKENDTNYFSIIDNGIGMNEEIIVNYFLRAGASFRNSQNWRDKFTRDNGSSLVQRNGRFGVGVFAGFLLGENIKVKTRNLNDDRTFEFEVSLAKDQIEVQVDKNPNTIGTEIKIEVTNSIMEILEEQLRIGTNYSGVSWHDWYKSSDINIKILIPIDWEKYSDKIKNKEIIKKDDISQQVLYSNNYQEIRWTNTNLNKYYDLVCNGIVIPNGYRLNSYDFPIFDKNIPLLMISDYDGHLPLTLDRNKIYGELPFSDELVADVCKDILANLLQIPTLEFDSNGKFKIINNLLKHVNLESRFHYFNAIEESDILFLKDGFCLVHSFNIDRLNLMSINKLWLNDLNDNFLNSEDSLNGIIFSERKPNAIPDFKNTIDNDYLKIDKYYSIQGKRIFLHKDRYKYLLEKDRMRAGFKKGIVEKQVGKNIVCLEIGLTDKNDFDFEMFDKNFKKFNLFCKYYLGPRVERRKVEVYRQGQSDVRDVFTEVLKNVMGHNVLVPYSPQSRATIHSNTFEILSKYILKYK